MLVRLGLALAVAATGVTAVAAAAAPPAPGAASRPAAAAPLLEGVDVSKWQHPYGAAINWSQVKAAGNSFAIVEDADGTYANPYFAADLQGIQQVGLVAGAYHFAEPSANLATADVEAANLLARTGTTRQWAFLAPVLDLETTNGLTPQQMHDWTKRFLDDIRAGTDRVPIVYSTAYFVNTYVANPASLAPVVFWEAAYTGGPAPWWPSPPGWPNWSIWQYGTKPVPGIQGDVDGNRFATSTYTDLLLLADGRDPRIVGLWHAQGGMSGPLGACFGAEQLIAGGHLLHCNGGDIYVSNATGAHYLPTAIAQAYAQAGGPTGRYGWPIADPQPIPGGQVSTFQKAKAVFAQATGTVTWLDPHLDVLGPYAGSGPRPSPAPLLPPASAPGSRPLTGSVRGSGTTASVGTTASPLPAARVPHR